jgi:hypothetical protein
MLINYLDKRPFYTLKTLLGSAEKRVASNEYSYYYSFITYPIKKPDPAIN